MSKIFFSSAVLFLFSLNLFSKDLKFQGLEKLKILDLQAITNTNLNKKNYSKNEIGNLINDLYKSDLIYDIKFVENDYSFLIEIVENKIINEIYVNDNSFITNDQILSIINSKKNSFQSKDKILSDLDTINSIYRTKGFLNASSSAKIEKFSKDRVNLIFEIYEGARSKINNIKFLGNKVYSDRYLSSIISSQTINFYNIFKSGSNLRPEIFSYDLNLISNFYKDRGFLDVKVSYDLESSLFGLYSLIFYIEEGPIFEIDKIEYDQSILDLEFIKKSLNDFEVDIKKNNQKFDFDIVSSHLLDLNTSLSRNNITNFYIDFEKIISDTNISLKFIKIDQLPININKINIYGNSITKDNTIRSKILIEPGDVYNPYIIESNIKTLERLPYINNIEFNKPDLDNSNSDFIIEENNKTGNILFAGTYDTDTEFGLTFGIEDKNFIGSGNTIDLNFNINSEDLRYDLNYIQYPLSNPFLTNKYTIYNQENDYSSSFGYKADRKGVGYKLYFSQNYKVSYNLGITYQSTLGHSGKNNSNISINDSIGEFNNIILSFGVKKDSTNDIFNPTDGHYNSLNLSVSPNEVSDDSYYKINLDNRNYFDIKNSKNFFFINNNIGYADSLNKKLKTVNAYSLGGNNFKGFDYRGVGPKSDSIYLGGNKFFTSTVGYGGSFIFDEKDNINIKLFATSGSIWDSDYTSDNNFKLRSASGISLDFLTAVGPISFIYAIPIDKQPNDNLRRFSFSIGSSF